MIIFKERTYKFDKCCQFVKVDSHPLSKESINKDGNLKETNKSKITSNQINSKISYVDPLSSSILFDPKQDPLSDCVDRGISNSNRSINMEPWSSKRISILTNYTTSEKLSIISSFLSRKPDEEVRILNKPPASIMDKVKSRLEQLDQFDEEVRETSNLNVHQFTEKINELQNALKVSWRDDQRVKSLQIIIQSTKLLSEANVLQFFPSKFVLITDLVDNFAQLVFDRLKSKSSYIQRGSKVPISLPDDFNESHVPEIAKETARNWFYKVASIRELVARLYIESCLLPSYRFFDSRTIPDSLLRLMRMCRGIGNDLLACYARAYIARVGIANVPLLRHYLELGFDDTIVSIQRVSNQHQEPYTNLFGPAIDWLLQCLCVHASDAELDAIVGKFEKLNSPVLVQAILNSISTNYIERRPLYFAEMIEALPDSGCPRYLMYKQLGACVSLSISIDTGIAMQLLNFVWKAIVKLSEPRHFIECCDAWAEFLARNLDIPQINRYLAHIYREMSRDGLYIEFANQLGSILNKIVNSRRDFQVFLTSAEFMQYVSMFDKEPYVIEVRQMVLDNFFNVTATAAKPLDDPVMIQTCIRMIKEMYDSLNSLSVADNRRVVSRLILTFIDRVKFETKNVEQELDLLTQLRSTFGDIEQVIVTIVERVNSLAMRVRSLRPNRDHNSSSASFVRACMAFSFITIPSVEDQTVVIRLYTSTAQVALVNGCLGQAEACIKESIYLISKLDNNSKLSDRVIDPSVVAEMSANLASTLLMCPDINAVLVTDNPNQNQQILYLLKGLINAINICPILKTDSVATQKVIIKGELYVKMILLLAAFSQPQYLYYAGKSDANDKVYGGSDYFQSVIVDIFKIVVPKIRSLNSPKTNQFLTDALSNILRMDLNTQDSLNKDWLSEFIDS